MLLRNLLHRRRGLIWRGQGLGFGAFAVEPRANLLWREAGFLCYFLQLSELRLRQTTLQIPCDRDFVSAWRGRRVDKCVLCRIALDSGGKRRDFLAAVTVERGTSVSNEFAGEAVTGEVSKISPSSSSISLFTLMYRFFFQALVRWMNRAIRKGVFELGDGETGGRARPRSRHLLCLPPLHTN